MNPLTQMRNLKKMNELELKIGVAGEKKSWHDVYKDSAWIFVGGLNFDLTEGDVISVFSQYGEIVNMNLVRDPKTGKSRGFAFICYEDQRSTILAVDNLNGIKLTGRLIRVDHVANYKPPKDKDETDELTRLIYERGCGPEVNIAQLEKEASKREAEKKLEHKGDKDGKRSLEKSWRRHDDGKRDRSHFEAKVKVEHDEDGDYRRAPVKAEYDSDGDIRRDPVITNIKVEYDDDGDIRRGSAYDDDGDVAVKSKRRSIEPSASHRNYHTHRKEYDDRGERSRHRDDDRRRDHGHHHGREHSRKSSNRS